MGAYKGIAGRKVYLDLTDIHVPKPSILRAQAAARKKSAAHQKATGNSLIGNQRKYLYPDELREAIDGYFKSCEGPIYSKYGQKILDDEGKPVLRVIKPYTISGLARHIGLSTASLLQYKRQAAMGLADEEYFDIIEEARQRIEEYAEGRLYDRDGSAGGSMVLRVGFGWMTKQERTDRKLKIAKARIEKLEHEAKLKLLQQGVETSNDQEIEIRIVRAKRSNEEE